MYRLKLSVYTVIQLHHTTEERQENPCKYTMPSNQVASIPNFQATSPSLNSILEQNNMN